MIDNITVSFNICELENIIMMHESVQRHWGHSFAVSAIQKCKQAKSKAIAAYEAEQDQAALLEYQNRPNKGEKIKITIK